MSLATIILAAGKGKRMKSDLPKVLHKLNGKPMLRYVIVTAQAIGSKRVVVVVGHKKELVMEQTRDLNVEFVYQENQLGTGHAVLQCASIFENFQGNLLVLSGDVPLLTKGTLLNLLNIHQKDDPLASLLTAKIKDPSGYGRIMRDSSNYVYKIVEHKDADIETLKINEINVGIYVFKSQELFHTLPLLKNENTQAEYYLPDVVKIYVENGQKVAAVAATNVEEIHGINNLAQLREAEKILRQRY